MVFGLRVINCAFGPKPCFICCSHHTRESTTTRLCYSTILTIVVVLSTASHEGGLMGMVYGRYKQEIDRFCNYVYAGDNCSRFAGFIGIYRLCLPLFFFHFVMSIFTIGVSSSQTIRGKIHNGFWAWKVIILFGLYISAYSFPNLENHVKVWMIFGIVGGLVFIYVQHITLIDFAYEVNGIWHAKAAKSVCYTFCIYTCTLVLYVATMTAYTVFVLLYGLPHQCTLNLTVTGINAGLTALFAICSAFSNTLQRKQLWLPGAVTSAFVAFLTWTALSSQPKTLSSDVPWQKKAVSSMDKSRNVSIHPILVVADQLNRLLSDQFSTENIRNHPSSGKIASATPTIMVNLCLPGGIGSLSEHLGKDLSTFVGLVVVIGGSLYSSFRTTMQARRLGIRTRREKLKRLLFPIEERPEPGDTVANTSSSQLDLDEPSSPRYLSRKEVRRQERGKCFVFSSASCLDFVVVVS
ncbi:uncharacterized protein DEA37_0008691 [Paragonimus westermani]|uniref:Serine incorporator 5 n=1 Tax=Paragonimus westermani TaxID=34504 RepID=A0A5J4NKL6_9TREM|nr:uncharacterized protein DEA37_0008691 [Paragonimus westermani]